MNLRNLSPLLVVGGGMDKTTENAIIEAARATATVVVDRLLALLPPEQKQAVPHSFVTESADAVVTAVRAALPRESLALKLPRSGTP